MDIFKGIFSVVNIFKNLSSLFQISVRGLLFNFLCTSMQSVTSILKFFLETGLLYFPLSFTFYAQDLFVFFRKGNSLRGRLGFPFFLAYNPCFIKKQGARISIFSALHLLSRILSNSKCLNLEGGNWEGRSPCLCTVVDPFSRQGFIYGKRE